jgi:hypothetical protein
MNMSPAIPLAGSRIATFMNCMPALDALENYGSVDPSSYKVVRRYVSMHRFGRGRKSFVSTWPQTQLGHRNIA